MRRYLFALFLSALVTLSGESAFVSANAPAQLPAPFPLPAPLYFLTGEHQLVRMDADDGRVSPISDPNQPIADFDISPDGDWVVFRTLYEGRVVVSNLHDGRGQVLALEGETPPITGPRQTIAWAPHGDAVAYIVAGMGVRIRSLFVQTDETTSARGPWVELYWADVDTLFASDEAGYVTRITYQDGHVTLETAPDASPRPQPPFPAYLSAQGIVYDNVPIPNTAGALAFDWGAPPLPHVQGLPLPADLFFLADGVLWRVPRDGEALYALVRGPQRRVWAYALSPDGTQIAYIADAPDGNATLHVLDLMSGADRTLPATLTDPPYDETAGPAWQPNGNLLAYADDAGLWLIAADGSTTPKLLFANQGQGDSSPPNTVRRYAQPCWNADGTRLLVTVTLWEGRHWLIYDMAAGTSRELSLPVTETRWADATHLLGWTAGVTVYYEPALYLISPDTPDEDALTVLLEGRAIYDVRYTPEAGLYVLASPLILSGPAYAEVLYTSTLAAPPETLPLGGFVDANWGTKTARLSPPAADGMPVLALLRQPVQQPESNVVSGDLVVLSVEHVVQIADGFAEGKAHTLHWGH